MAGITANTSKLRDDLKITEEKFNIESYLSSNEAAAFLSTLPGLKDIIKATKGLLSKISDFANMILDFIDKILSFLNLNNILDSLGLKSLLKFITDLISSGLSMIGLPIGARSEINSMFNSVCMPLSSGLFSDGYDKNILERFALLSLIIGLSCSMPGQAYTNLFLIMNNTPEITDLRDRVSLLETDIATANNNPVFTFDAAANDYVINQVETDAKVAKLESELLTLTTKVTAIEQSIAKLFASIVPVIFDNVATVSNAGPASIIGLVTEIANHETATVVSTTNNNLATSILYSLDYSLKKTINSEKITDHSNVLYENIFNQLTPLSCIGKGITFRDEDVIKAIPTSVTSRDLINNLTRLDTSDLSLVLNNSIVIKALIRTEYKRTPFDINSLHANCPNAIIDSKLRYLA